MLRLPRKLLIHMLSYIVRKGDTILMEEGTISRERRRWKAEVERLKDPNWKRPKREDFPGYLLTRRELYISSVDAYWGGNTLSFATLGELQKFLDMATGLAKDSVKSINLFHDQGVNVHSPTAGHASLQLFSALPKLQSVDINATFLRTPTQNVNTIYSSLSPLSGETTASLLPGHDLPRRELVLDSLVERDALLKTIPTSILANLKMLKIRNQHSTARYSWNTAFALPANPPVLTWREFDILPYVQDLHSGEWDTAPFPMAGASATLIAEEARHNKLWQEARAAVYWVLTTVRLISRERKGSSIDGVRGVLSGFPRSRRRNGCFSRGALHVEGTCQSLGLSMSCSRRWMVR